MIEVFSRAATAVNRHTVRNFSCVGILALVGILDATYGQVSGGAPETRSLRLPFVLKLHIDDQRFCEARFGAIPYVDAGDVYLFAGEHFGINIDVSANHRMRIAFERDPEKADVSFRFTQEKSRDQWTMLLAIRNRLRRAVLLDALITMPGRDGVYETNILPIEPNRTNFEAWPHPILQLVLRHVRLSQERRTSPGTSRRTDGT